MIVQPAVLNLNSEKQQPDQGIAGAQAKTCLERLSSDWIC